MKQTIVFIMFLLLSCADAKREEEVVVEENREEDLGNLPPASVAADTTDGKPYIAILENERFNGISISKNELRQIEKLLVETVEVFNVKNPDNKIDLRYYKRQYVPQVSAQGKKEVTIYGMCSTMGDAWQTHIRHVKDGGKCYFNVVVNLTDNTFDVLYIHGEA